MGEEEERRPEDRGARLHGGVRGSAELVGFVGPVLVALGDELGELVGEVEVVVYDDGPELHEQQWTVDLEATSAGAQDE